MTAGTTAQRPLDVTEADLRADGWLLTTDHKRIALMTLGVALFVFFGMGIIAMIMRAQLAQPGMHVVDAHTYDQLFTIHGSGMIYLAITPFAIGMGLYLVPLQIGAPSIAGPRLALFSFWLYVTGVVSILGGFATIGGAGSAGWFAYVPLSDSRYTPGAGQDMWIFGTFCATTAMILMSGVLVWTVLFKRAPGMTMLRLPLFTWSIIASVLMVIAAFPSLLAALGLMVAGRIDPSIFHSQMWTIGYQHLFWFYGHPVVYVMFFPFVGAVAEVLSTFSGRPFVGYKATVLSLLTFAALSMSVWGHHMFTTGQAADEYYSLTSNLLAVPAGIEYFGMIGTLIGGRLRFPTPMLFALAFIPQFLVGGLTGIMVSAPALDYQLHESYFLIGHFHYTLLAGSTFGFFAGVYYWFPKATGRMLGERLGKAHFWLMVIGTNVTFLPFFALGMLGMTRRVETYSGATLGTLNLVSSLGAGVLALSLTIFLLNLLRSLLLGAPAGDDPWQGNTLEWLSSSPPPRFNFGNGRFLPRVHSFTPVLDLRRQQLKQQQAAET